MINEFIKQFFDDEIDFIRIDDSFFYLSDDLKKIYNLIKEKGIALDETEYIGGYLGKIKKNKFIPSFIFLELINKNTDRKAIINHRASWLFLCGRDVFKKSIIECKYNGEVIVVNEFDEVLGYGISNNQGIRNLIDRGDFLRREKNKSNN